MKYLVIILMLILTLGLSGCAGMSDTEQRTLSGGAIGTGVGAVVGAISGHTVWGAAIGAVAGSAGGYLYDKDQKSKEASYQKGYEAGQHNK